MWEDGHSGKALPGPGAAGQRGGPYEQQDPADSSEGTSRPVRHLQAEERPRDSGGQHVRKDVPSQ